MTRDDTLIDLLREEYKSQVSPEVKRVRAVVDAEMDRKAAEETALRTVDIRTRFARRMGEAYAAGRLRTSDISRIIGTARWDYVLEWRDLAGIPSRDGKRKMKIEAVQQDQGWRWEKSDTPFGWTLVVDKDRAGANIPEMRFSDITVNAQTNALEIWPEDHNRDVWEAHFKDAADAHHFARDIAEAHRDEIDK